MKLSLIAFLVLKLNIYSKIVVNSELYSQAVQYY